MAVIAMKFLSVAFLFALLAIPGTAQPDKGELTIVASPDVPVVLSQERLSHCLKMLVRETKVQANKLPHIVVFQVSKKAARGAYITEDIAVRRNQAGRVSEHYYEVWLVGEPKLNYVVALENVLEDHFGLTFTEKERGEILTRIARAEDATVSVAEGK